MRRESNRGGRERGHEEGERVMSTLQVGDAVSGAQDIPLSILEIADKQLVVSESLSDFELLLLVSGSVSELLAGGDLAPQTQSLLLELREAHLGHLVALLVESKLLSGVGEDLDRKEERGRECCRERVCEIDR